MKFRINIKQIELFGYHGVLPDEKKNGQNFLIDINYVFNKINKSDNINSTIDYSKICDIASESFFANRYDLLENLAKDIANSIINHFSNIEEITLSVTKTNPPMDTPALSVSVSTTLLRDQ